MLSYLENQMGEIAGVSKQRQGQVSSSELVGNVERAVVQSSHITEKWFSSHDNTKSRAMATLLETAKYAWRDKSKKLQYVTDDLTTVMFEVDGKIFNESEYGLFISNTSGDAQLEQSLKQLAHAGIQNDKLKWSQLMDIYYSDSITSIRRKIEQGEQEQLEQKQQDQQMQQQAQQAQERALEIATTDREDRQLHEKEIKQMDNNTKLEVAYINSADKEYDRDLNNNNVPDDIELQKLMQMQEKINNDFSIKQQKLQQDDTKMQNDKALKEKDLNLKEKALNKKDSNV